MSDNIKKLIVGTPRGEGFPGGINAEFLRRLNEIEDNGGEIISILDTTSDVYGAIYRKIRLKRG